MRKLTFALFSSLALLAAGSANAADMPVRGPVQPAMVAPVFSWTGFYIGANVGYGWGDTDRVALFTNFSDMDGILGGVQGGFNYQFAGTPFVIGIEADYQWADISSNFVQVNRFGTVRGRVGYAWDRFMLYGTGGWAFEANTEVNFGLGLLGSRSLDGWTAGAGIEWAFLPNWSAKLEYLHIDLKSDTFFGPNMCPLGCQAGADIDLIRVGLNWRFGGLFGSPYGAPY